MRNKVLLLGLVLLLAWTGIPSAGLSADTTSNGRQTVNGGDGLPLGGGSETGDDPAFNEVLERTGDEAELIASSEPSDGGETEMPSQLEEGRDTATSGGEESTPVLSGENESADDNSTVEAEQTLPASDGGSEQEATTLGSFEYSDNGDGTATITGYRGEGGQVNIPDTIDGLKVTVIGFYAFNNKQLTSTTIPDSVTKIDNGAFRGNQLTRVTIPDSVKGIGSSAFENNQLTTVTIPSEITTIETSTFANNRLESVTIPYGVENIGLAAFQNNRLISVTIPDSVTHIHHSAFANNQLKSVNIPYGVKSIEGSAFQYNQLTRVTIPDSITQIQNFVFANNQLRSVNIPYGVESIEGSAFKDNELTSVTIPVSVTQIGASAFLNNKLESINIPDSVESIGLSAFKDNKLTNVTIPDSVTQIDISVFENNQLESVNIPDSVESIGSAAFKQNRLTSVAIPNSVTEIGTSAFMENRLKSVHIPNSAAHIGAGAFQHNELTSVTIPDSVTKIDSLAFEYNKLTSVIIAGFPEFGYYVFQNNSAGLTLTGYAGSSVEEYATDNGHRFDSVHPIKIEFSPDGDDTWSTSASTVVTVEHHDENQSLLYAWSNDVSPPDDLDEWESFVSRGTIEKDSVDGEWYLHIRAYGRLGNEVKRRSEPFRLDNTAPEVTINMSLETDSDQAYTGDWTNQNVAVELTAEDEHSGVAAIEYKLHEEDAWQLYAEPFDVSAEGISTVYVRAIDNAGNMSETEQSTIRIDRTAPKLTLKGDSTMNIPYGSEYVEPGYDISDNLDEDISEKVDIRGDVDTSTVGTYTITYRVEDHAGNEAVVTRTVNVVDEEAPVITLIGDNTITLEFGSKYEEPGATAIDNVDGDLSGEVEISGEVNTDQVGTYSLTYTVKDRSGNTASATRTVIVSDTTPPSDVELTVQSKTTHSIILGLSAYDLSGIKAYELYRNGQHIATVDGTETTFLDSNLESGQTYTYSVIAVDPWNNESEEVNLSVMTDLVVAKVAELPDMTVEHGTTFSDVPLPDEIEITLSNGEVVAVPVKWDSGHPTYDGTESGTYVFTGVLEPPSGVLNPENLAAIANVTVLEKVPTENKKQGSGTDHKYDKKIDSPPDTLPQTVTPYYNALLLGLVLILVGGALFLWRKKRTVS